MNVFPKDASSASQNLATVRAIALIGRAEAAAGFRSVPGPQLHPTGPQLPQITPHAPPAAGLLNLTARTAAAEVVQLQTLPRSLRTEAGEALEIGTAYLATPTSSWEFKIMQHACTGAAGFATVVDCMDGSTMVVYPVASGRGLPALKVALNVDQRDKAVRMYIQTPSGINLNLRCEKMLTNADWFDVAKLVQVQGKGFLYRMLTALAEYRPSLEELGLLPKSIWPSTHAGLAPFLQSLASSGGEMGEAMREAMQAERVTAATLHMRPLEDLHKVVLALAKPDEKGTLRLPPLSINDVRWLKPFYINHLNCSLLKINWDHDGQALRAFFFKGVVPIGLVGTGHPWPDELSGTLKIAGPTLPGTRQLQKVLREFLADPLADSRASVAKSFLRRYVYTRAAGESPHTPADVLAFLPFKESAKGMPLKNAEDAATGDKAVYEPETMEKLTKFELGEKAIKALNYGLGRFLHRSSQEGVGAADGAAGPAGRVVEMPETIWQLASGEDRRVVWRVCLQLPGRTRAPLPRVRAAIQDYIRLAIGLQNVALKDMVNAAPQGETRFRALPDWVREQAERQLVQDSTQVAADMRGSALRALQRLPLQVQRLVVEGTAGRQSHARVKTMSWMQAMFCAHGGRSYDHVPGDYVSPVRLLREHQAFAALMVQNWIPHSRRAYQVLVHRSDACRKPGQTPDLIEALRLARGPSGTATEVDFDAAAGKAALSHLKDRLGTQDTQFVRQVLRNLICLRGPQEATVRVTTDQALEPELVTSGKRLQDVAEALRNEPAGLGTSAQAALDLLGVWMLQREMGELNALECNPFDHPVAEALREHPTSEAFHAAVRRDLISLRQRLQLRFDDLKLQLQPWQGGGPAPEKDAEHRPQLERQLRECDVQLSAALLSTLVAWPAFDLLYEQAKPLRDFDQKVKEAMEKAEKEKAEADKQAALAGAPGGGLQHDASDNQVDEEAQVDPEGDGDLWWGADDDNLPGNAMEDDGW